MENGRVRGTKSKKVILIKTRYCILFGILFKKLHNPIYLSGSMYVSFPATNVTI